MRMGKAGYGKGGFKKKNRWKVGKDPIIARIFPPMGTLADNPKGWARYHAGHFGYKNMEGKSRPFESTLVKNNKTKMIEVPDAALERLDKLKAQLEQARLDQNGPMIARLISLIGSQDQLGVYNLDKNQHMVVQLLDGSIGNLAIRYKHKLALDAEIDRLNKEGVDPLDLQNGRYFVFSRSNTGRDTTFHVSVYKEKVEATVNGKTKMVEEDVVSRIGPEVIARLSTEAKDLDEIFPKITAEEVAQIVAESDLLTGKSPACDRIFDQRWKAARDAKKAAQTQAKESAEAAQNYENGPDDDGPDEAPAVAPAASAPATSAAPVAAAKAAPAAPLEEMSDEEFLRSVGAPA